MNGFESIKDIKKLLEKIKRVCTIMSKYNINSPCLLQFIRINGEYEVILTHNPVNGDRFDFYKIFSTVTHDEFEIDEEDKDCFISNDERVSIPIIVSSCPLTERNEITQTNPYIYWSNKPYDFCINSYYIFPKFMLQAIKMEIIKDFEVLPLSPIGNNYRFEMNIIYDTTITKYKNALFINNCDKLDYLYNLSILPLFRKSTLNDLLEKVYIKENSSGFLIINSESWDEYYEKYKFYNSMNLKGSDNNEFLIYHNDFFQKKLKNIYVSKFYENANNIVTLYFDIEDSHGIHSYLKYRYYEK